MAQTTQTSLAKEPHFFVTAVQKDGSPAALQESELNVYLDKTPAHVTDVHSAKDDPLVFAVLVDISKSDAEGADSVRGAALEIFEGLTNANAQGYLVLFNQQVAVSRAPLSVSQAKQALDTTRFEGGTAIYDAIEQTCKQLLSGSENPNNVRRIVVVLSDGEDNVSHIAHSKAEEAAIEEGVSVFSIVLNPTVSQARGEKFLREASEKTGGFATSKNIKKAVPVILEAIKSQSEIRLAPTKSDGGRLHAIAVKSKQKGVQIFAPAGLPLP